MSDNNSETSNTNEDDNIFFHHIIEKFKHMEPIDYVYLVCLIIVSGAVIFIPQRIKHSSYDIIKIFRTPGIKIIICLVIITFGFEYNIVVASTISLLCIMLLWISYGIGSNKQTTQIINTSDKFKQLMDILLINNEDDNNNNNNNNNNNDNNNNKKSLNINNEEEEDNKSIMNIINNLPITDNKKNKIKNIGKNINRLSNIMFSDGEYEENLPLLSNNNIIKYNINNNEEDKDNKSQNTSYSMNLDLKEAKNLINNKIKNKINNNDNIISLNVSKKLKDYNKLDKKKIRTSIINDKNRNIILNKMKKFGINNDFSDNNLSDDIYDNLFNDLSDNEVINTSSSDNELNNNNNNKNDSSLRKSDTFIKEELKPSFIKFMLNECNKLNNAEEENKFLDFVNNMKKSNKNNKFSKSMIFQ